jgi:hypothetical protein
VILLLTSAAAAAPRIAVVDCAPAAAWLSSAGVECLPLSAEALETAPVPDVQLLILPLDRVRSTAVLRSVTAFAARGGKVIGVYWAGRAKAGPVNV